MNTFHRDLLRDTFKDGLSEEDSLVLFAVLHSCDIELREPVISDCPSACRLESITTRDAADSVAKLWSRTGGEKAYYAYWYYVWNADWEGYKRLERMSREDAKRACRLKELLERHPWVKAVVPNAWNPFEPEIAK